MSSRHWADQRGFTLAELLMAAAVGAVVLLGMFSLYRATTTAFNQSSSQAYLQRQGTLALQEIARQAQRASSSTPDPLAPCPTTNALQLTVNVPSSLPLTEIGLYCYYSAANGVGDPTLWEKFIQKSNGSIRTRDLLFGATGLLRQTGKKGVFLLSQTSSPKDPRCPTTVAAGPCLTLVPPVGPTATADVTFAITDGLNGMSFTASLKLRNS